MIDDIPETDTGSQDQSQPASDNEKKKMSVDEMMSEEDMMDTVAEEVLSKKNKRKAEPKKKRKKSSEDEPVKKKSKKSKDTEEEVLPKKIPEAKKTKSVTTKATKQPKKVESSDTTPTKTPTTKKPKTTKKKPPISEDEIQSEEIIKKQAPDETIDKKDPNAPNYVMTNVGLTLETFGTGDLMFEARTNPEIIEKIKKIFANVGTHFQTVTLIFEEKGIRISLSATPPIVIANFLILCDVFMVYNCLPGTSIRFDTTTNNIKEGLKPVENYKNGLESASFCFARKTPHILTILYKKSSGGVFTCNVNGTEKIENNKFWKRKDHGNFFNVPAEDFKSMIMSCTASENANFTTDHCIEFQVDHETEAVEGINYITNIENSGIIEGSKMDKLKKIFDLVKDEKKTDMSKQEVALLKKLTVRQAELVLESEDKKEPMEDPATGEKYKTVTQKITYVKTALPSEEGEEDLEIPSVAISLHTKYLSVIAKFTSMLEGKKCFSIKFPEAGQNNMGAVYFTGNLAICQLFFACLTTVSQTDETTQ